MRTRLHRLVAAAWIAFIAGILASVPALADGTSVIFPDPVSPNGHRIYDLYVLVSWFAIPIFIGVEVLLVVIIVRFRRRTRDQVGKQIHGNVPLEIAWFIAPTVIVTLIAVLSFVELQRDFVRPTDAQTQMDISVHGYQFFWEYEYPGSGGIKARDTMVVPVGTLVRLTFSSTDVIHSWWVPAITGKTDAVPGYENYSWLKIDPKDAGKTWHGECAELCGAGHSGMQIDVKAVSKADFDAWVVQQQSKPKPSPSPAK
jgi:cytochrome c oxidase subunit 2